MKGTQVTPPTILLVHTQSIMMLLSLSFFWGGVANAWYENAKSVGWCWGKTFKSIPKIESCPVFGSASASADKLDGFLVQMSWMNRNKGGARCQVLIQGVVGDDAVHAAEAAAAGPGIRDQGMSHSLRVTRRCRASAVT